jgi:hypothetical protein
VRRILDFLLYTYASMKYVYSVRFEGHFITVTEARRVMEFTLWGNLSCHTTKFAPRVPD